MEARPRPRALSPLARPATEALLDVVQLVHRATRLGFEPSGEEEAAPSPAALAAAAAAGEPGVDVFGLRHPAVSLEEVRCPSCSRTMAAGRFAPHLEKCTGKGRSAAKRSGGAPSDEAAPAASPSPSPPPGPSEIYVPSWTHRRPPGPKKAKLSPPVPLDDFSPGGAQPRPDAVSCDVNALAWSGGREGTPGPPPWPQGVGPEPAKPPKAAAGAGMARRKLRARVSACVSLEALRAYAQQPPPADAGEGSLSEGFRTIRGVASELRGLEPAGGETRSLGDVPLLLLHLCAVPSVRGQMVGKLCSNGLGCTQHREAERDEVRQGLFSGWEGGGQLRTTPRPSGGAAADPHRIPHSPALLPGLGFAGFG